MRYYIFILFSIIVATGCRQEKKYHDRTQEETVFLKMDTIQDILQFHTQLNEKFKNPDTSPLQDKDRKKFQGLDFFEPDPNYVILAKFVRTPDALPFMMPTTTDRKSEKAVYGVAHFLLNGEEHQLEIYQDRRSMSKEEYKDYLFLPFTDKTNGEETYAGGRYIDLPIPEGDFITINFNKAYNPYCAYNKKYSCPLVPGINAMRVKVLAGVKAFKK